MKLIKPSAHIVPLNPDPLKHIEAIARTCYKSEDKITDESAPKFVKMLYDRGHYAMLEFYPFYFHVDVNLTRQLSHLNQLPTINGDFKYYDRGTTTVTASCNLRTVIMLNEYDNSLSDEITATYPNLQFLFKQNNVEYTGAALNDIIELDLQYETVRFITNRGVTHELVRHRMCSFAQESTRYCNYGGKNMEFILPSHFEQDHISKEPSHSYLVWLDTLIDAESIYNTLLKDKQTPQQARGILPNDLKTEIVVQARLSEWKHIFNLRCAKTAHPDMQEVMIPLRDKFIQKYPNYFENGNI
jgi:thymidylate synthase (FAD)